MRLLEPSPELPNLRRSPFTATCDTCASRLQIEESDLFRWTYGYTARCWYLGCRCPVCRSRIVVTNCHAHIPRYPGERVWRVRAWLRRWHRALQGGLRALDNALGGRFDPN